jgi:hypothetical protein
LTGLDTTRRARRLSRGPKDSHAPARHGVWRLPDDRMTS